MSMKHIESGEQVELTKQDDAANKTEYQEAVVNSDGALPLTIQMHSPLVTIDLTI